MHSAPAAEARGTIEIHKPIVKVVTLASLWMICCWPQLVGLPERPHPAGDKWPYKYVRSIYVHLKRISLITRIISISLQVTGVIVLGMGIWLLADKASFIGLLNTVEHEQVQVSNKGLLMTPVRWFLEIQRTLSACGSVLEYRDTDLLFVYSLWC